jgi:hypothetical protein
MNLILSSRNRVVAIRFLVLLYCGLTTAYAATASYSASLSVAFSNPGGTFFTPGSANLPPAVCSQFGDARKMCNDPTASDTGIFLGPIAGDAGPGFGFTEGSSSATSNRLELRNSGQNPITIQAEVMPTVSL